MGQQLPFNPEGAISRFLAENHDLKFGGAYLKHFITQFYSALLIKIVIITHIPAALHSVEGKAAESHDLIKPTGPHELFQ